MRKHLVRWAATALCTVALVHAQEAKVRTVHVFVALADNQHQGIVPVAPVLGNGEDAYDKYQRCEVKAARRLLVSGW